MESNLNLPSTNRPKLNKTKIKSAFFGDRGDLDIGSSIKNIHKTFSEIFSRIRKSLIRIGILENKILNHLEKLFNSVNKIGISIYVLPFLEGTSLKNYTFNKQLDILNKIEPLIPNDISVCLETDLNPKNLKQLINSLDTKKFSINYDIGNSAFEGYNYLEEFESYFQFIANIHVKDRVYQGPTVPLGHGDAKIHSVLTEIKKRGYTKNLILQAARQDKIEDTTVVETYFKMVKDVIGKE